jgi:hypothetical protein
MSETGLACPLDDQQAKPKAALRDSLLEPFHSALHVDARYTLRCPFFDFQST